MLSSLISASSSSSSSGSAVFQIVFFGAIFAAMYFLLLRPQRKRARESMELQRGIEINDEVELTSGIIGFIAAIDDEEGYIWLDIAEGVEIRIRRGAIAKKLGQSGTATPGDTTPTTPKK